MHSSRHNKEQEACCVEFEGHREIKQSLHSQVATTRARYSASDEERETVNCFFMRHEMRNLPMKKYCSEMDLCVSARPAQSTSKQPIYYRCESLERKIPRAWNPLRYMRVLMASL